ncbi:MAG: hypothetical protein ACPG4N_00040 [Gammaproteobacteria bacterium]
MPDNELLTGTIDEYLVSLAEGIHDAQKQLNQLRLNTVPGQAPTTYFIPKLDFELKLSFELDRSSTNGGTTGKKNLLRARSVSPGSSSTETTSSEATSVIRGSFVSVPVAGGKPSPVIETSIEKLSKLAARLTVSVVDTLGTPLEGIEVQFNLDRERSEELSPLPAIMAAPRDGTDISDAVVFTDGSGIAQTLLSIDEYEPAGSFLVIVVDAQGGTEEIIFPVEGQGSADYPGGAGPYPGAPYAPGDPGMGAAAYDPAYNAAYAPGTAPAPGTTTPYPDANYPDAPGTTDDDPAA